MPLYKFLHNLLNVLVQISNKMGLQKITLLYTHMYILVDSVFQRKVTCYFSLTESILVTDKTAL
jgi:hypothetical protein